jgi:hypothetical protein
MENWIQAVPAIILIAALLVAIRYILRHWPDSRKKIGNELRRLTSAIESFMPGMSAEIGKIRRQFRKEISRIFPLWSAATTENREAEFIHDRLPDRFPSWFVVLAVVVVVSLVWLITR